MHFRKLLVLFLIVLNSTKPGYATKGLSVVVSAKPRSMEDYAAKELCRYINLLTGELPQITNTLTGKGFILKKTKVECGPQGYMIKKIKEKGQDVILIAANE